VIAYFLSPYRRDRSYDFPARVCTMNDFTSAIHADGGSWSESEIAGDQAVVKVSASSGTMALIEAAGHRPLTRAEIPALLATPRKAPTYDRQRDRVTLNGSEYPCKTLAQLDSEVR